MKATGLAPVLALAAVALRAWGLAPRPLVRLPGGRPRACWSNARCDHSPGLTGGGVGNAAPGGRGGGRSPVVRATAESLVEPAVAEMGARVDGPATAAFGFIMLSFAVLRFAVNGATAARDRRDLFEEELQQKKIAAVVGDPNAVEELAAAEARMEELKQAAEDARLLRLFGLSVRLVIPDGDLNPNLTDRQRERLKQQRQRQQREQQRELEPGGGKDVGSLSLGQKITLIFVLISQLWLLSVLLFTETMPNSSTVGGVGFSAVAASMADLADADAPPR